MPCMWWAHNVYSANHEDPPTFDLRCRPSPIFNNRANVRPRLLAISQLVQKGFYNKNSSINCHTASSDKKK